MANEYVRSVSDRQRTLYSMRITFNIGGFTDWGQIKMKRSLPTHHILHFVLVLSLPIATKTCISGIRCFTSRFTILRCVWRRKWNHSKQVWHPECDGKDSMNRSKTLNHLWSLFRFLFFCFVLECFKFRLFPYRSPLYMRRFAETGDCYPHFEQASNNYVAKWTSSSRVSKTWCEQHKFHQCSNHFKNNTNSAGVKTPKPKA